MAQLIHDAQPRTAILKGMDEIIPHLWLGDILSTYNTEKIQEKGITHVISLIDQPLPQWLRTRYQELGIKHKEFEIQDDELEDILKVMAESCDLIDDNISNSGVLVHCGLGISRSGSVIVGYIMRSRQLDREEALRFVKKNRERVQPNTGFWKQLEVWSTCGFEVWDEVDGVRMEKDSYKNWKMGAEEKMKERIQGFQ